MPRSACGFGSSTASALPDRREVALLEDRAVVHLGDADRDRLAQRIVGDARAAVEHERDVDGAPDCFETIEVEPRPPESET